MVSIQPSCNFFSNGDILMIFGYVIQNTKNSWLSKMGNYRTNSKKVCDKGLTFKKVVINDTIQQISSYDNKKLTNQTSFITEEWRILSKWFDYGKKNFPILIYKSKIFKIILILWNSISSLQKVIES